MGQTLEKNFKHYQLLAVDAIDNLNKAKKAVKEAPDPLSLTKAKKELEIHTKNVEVAKEKLQAYGGGTIIKVTGNCWKKVPDGKPSYKTSFSIYLNCKSVEDAKEVFEAQVEKDGIFMDSIQFHTIELKSTIIH